jgi:hypothetical protein
MITTEEIREGNFRCRPFTGGRMGLNKIRVYPGGDLRVWDSVAGYFTSCHDLSEKSCKRLISNAHRYGYIVRKP